MSGPTYVVDASVFVADARPSEFHHATSHALLEHIRGKTWQIYTPTIVLAEVAAAISRGVGDPLVATRLIALIQRIPHVSIIHVDDTLGKLAAELAAQHCIRGCDAIYVALAQQRNATLITLDQQQKDRVPSTVAARTPAEEVAVLSI